MVITFGTRFYGKVATVNNQWIETKFFSILFLPIFPISSIYVTASEYNSRKGFKMAINSKSVTAAYGRLLCFVIAAWLLFIAYAEWSDGHPDALSYIIIYGFLGLLFAALWIYFCFYYGKAKPDDILLRNKVGHVTGLYALPNWFDAVQLWNQLESLKAEYKGKYPDNDWKTDLSGDIVDPDKYLLLFGVALFNCMVYDLPENDELYAKADQLFILKQESILY